MTIDWDQFDTAVGDAADRSANATDDILASKISSLTTMTDAEVKELLPEPADVEALGKLLKIVQSASDRNTKISQIAANGEAFAGVVLGLAKKFV